MCCVQLRCLLPVQCLIGTAFRRDCGFSGISRSDCMARSCCYDASMRNRNFCFTPANQPINSGKKQACWGILVVSTFSYFTVILVVSTFSYFYRPRYVCFHIYFTVVLMSTFSYFTMVLVISTFSYFTMVLVISTLSYLTVVLV